MNSDQIYRDLNRMINDPKLDHRHRVKLRQVVQHIHLLQGEILELKDDITDVKFENELGDSK